tara:strand:- start:1487 stop:1948 length:462 start_codon:yes stop_codon:yes gene_type:complete
LGRVIFKETRVERVVNVPRNYFWNRIRAFGEIKTLLPETLLEVKLPKDFSNSIGDLRSVYLGDPYPGEVIERLVGVEEGLSLTYSIVDKSCLPISNYVACVNLKDFSSNDTAVSWCGHFVGDGNTEDEIVDLLEALYNLILNNIEDQYKKYQS